MLRFWVSAAALGIALGGVACTATSASEKTASEASHATTATLSCEGVTGIEKLKLVAKADVVGIAAGRVYLRSSTKCASTKLDGTDKQDCPAPNAETVARALIGQDAEYLYFRADAALFRTHLATGQSELLHSGPTENARLAGDVLMWSGPGTEPSTTELRSMPKAGGESKVVFSLKDSGERSVSSGTIASFSANAGDVLTSGRGGLRLVGADGTAARITLPGGDDSLEIADAVLTQKAITFRHEGEVWTIDRASNASKKLLSFPESVAAHGFAADGESVVAYFDDESDEDKPTFVHVRLVGERAGVLLQSNLRIGSVHRADGLVLWSLTEADGSTRFFSVPEAEYGKKSIQCRSQTLSAPVKDAGPEKDAGPKPAKDAGTKDAGKAPPPPPGDDDDDDDVETSTDPTEPESEDEPTAEDPGTTVTINPACQSTPGVAAGSPFVVVLGLALLAFRRRR